MFFVCSNVGCLHVIILRSCSGSSCSCQSDRLFKSMSSECSCWCNVLLNSQGLPVWMKMQLLRNFVSYHSGLNKMCLSCFAIYCKVKWCILWHILLFCDVFVSFVLCYEMSLCVVKYCILWNVMFYDKICFVKCWNVIVNYFVKMYHHHLRNAPNFLRDRLQLLYKI